KLRIKVIKELGLNENLTADNVLEIVKIIFNQISKECIDKKIKFVYGKGKRKHQLQREYEKFKDWKNRLEKYHTQLRIMGDYRNSYSKTDHDATFMRMKDDHMRNRS